MTIQVVQDVPGMLVVQHVVLCERILCGVIPSTEVMYQVMVRYAKLYLKVGNLHDR